MGKPDYAAMFPKRWMWPLVEAGELLLYELARYLRWLDANRDAKNGVHANHQMCRGGRAVTWKR